MKKKMVLKRENENIELVHEDDGTVTFHAYDTDNDGFGFESSRVFSKKEVEKLSKFFGEIED